MWAVKPQPLLVGKGKHVQVLEVEVFVHLNFFLVKLTLEVTFQPYSQGEEVQSSAKYIGIQLCFLKMNDKFLV